MTEKSSSEQQTQQSGSALQDKLKAYMPLLRYTLRALLKGSLLIVGLSVLLAWYLWNRKRSTPSYYTATLTFSLSEDKGFQQDLMTSLLGFGGVSASESSDLNLTKIEELLSTRKVISLALFEELELRLSYEQPKKDYLINHYIDLLGMRGQWREQGSALADFRFTHHALDSFSRTENSILLSVFGKINQQHLSSFRSGSGIFTISFQSSVEEFSFEFCHVLYQVVEDYYSEKSVEKQRKIYEAAMKRKAMLKEQLDADEYNYYNYLDRRNAAATQEVNVRIFALQKKLMTTMEAYFLAVKNSEASAMALEQKMPVMQLIDPPIYPLSATHPNPTMHLLIGAFIGFFFGLALVLGWVFARYFLWGLPQKKA